MSRIKKMKVKLPSGEYSEYIDFGANAANVDMADGRSVEKAFEDLQTNFDTLSQSGFVTKDADNLENYMLSTKIENDYAKKTEIPSISGLINKDVRNLTYYYDKDQVDAKLVSATHYKGDVDTYDELLLLKETAEAGDMYNIKQESEHNRAGDNAVWNDTTQEWDVLSGMVDLTDYAKKTDVPSLIDLSGYYTKEETYSQTEIDKQIEDINNSLKDYLKSAEAEKTYLKVTDETVVKTSGDQSIDGVKTFAEIPVIPETVPTLDTQATSKKYVDDTVKDYLPLAGGTMSGAIELDGGYQVSNDGTASLKNVTIDSKCQLVYDETNKCLKFNFNK